MQSIDRPQINLQAREEDYHILSSLLFIFLSIPSRRRSSPCGSSSILLLLVRKLARQCCHCLAALADALQEGIGADDDHDRVRHGQQTVCHARSIEGGTRNEWNGAASD